MTPPREMRQDEIDSVALAVVELIAQRVHTSSQALSVCMHALTRVGMEACGSGEITPRVADVIEEVVHGWCALIRQGGLTAVDLTVNVAPGSEARN